MNTPNGGAPGTPDAASDASQAGKGSGKTDEAVLDAALDKVIDALEAPGGEPKGAAGDNAPAPGAQPAGAGSAGPGKPADTETPEQKLEREELAARAKANGVSAEEQAAAEEAELKRLQTISDKTGETPEQIQAREEKGEPEPGAKTEKKFSQEDVDRVVQKRVHKLEGEVEGLRRQLAERPGTATAGGGDPLAAADTPEKLAEAKRLAETRQAKAQRLLRQLSYAPGNVEKWFRELAAKEPAVAEQFQRDGAEQYGVDRMAEFLENLIEGQSEILAAVPQRERFLEARNKGQEQVRRVFPFLQDAEDERTLAVNDLLAKAPWFKAVFTVPEAAALRWLYGPEALKPFMEKAAGRLPAVKKFVPKVKFPGTARPGTATARNATDLEGKVRKMRQSGSEADALEVVSEVLGGGSG
jgi:hypothetical protein